ncbi:four-jointed box protein 1-like isoform X2 [Mercenaria mercenaria]|uniref:four-jointed box protein 1-like isoform X2 n=1 Tax=Mercenaria mercenaria TaxID=6596 RepID=UPI00234F77AF|nr:four-jointed box protein 1-like isoform X2 [Mercenaria mercenaria]
MNNKKIKEYDNNSWKIASDECDQIACGLSFDECVKHTIHLQGQAVEALTKSTMGVCGRQLNALITLKDGTTMCAKYRGKYKAYGEVLTFYLSRLLHMNNVPLAFLVKTNATSVFWKQVNISSLSWEENQIVTLIEWISNSSKTRLPPIIYDAFIKRQPITGRTISSSNIIDKTPEGIAEIVQWGTVILLDFLTAHLDRYVRINFAEGRGHHPSFSSNYTKNLIHSKNGKIWLIDNESTFFLSYFLTKCAKYNCVARRLRFYEVVLKTVCVFQRSVVNALMRQLRNGSIYKSLLLLSKTFQPLQGGLTFDDKYSLIADVLNKRVAQVVKWIQYCQHKHQF